VPRVRRLANVWAAPCEKCKAQTDAPCRDLRGNNRLLFGRRTHRERAKAVRALKVMETITTDLPTFTRAMKEYNHAITLAANNATTAFRQVGTAIQYTGTITANTAYTTTGNFTVTRDEIWQGWTVGNTTTGTYTQINDMEMARFQDAGIRFDWTHHPQYYTTEDAQVVIQQEMVWQGWNDRDQLNREQQLRLDRIQEQREANNRRLHAEAEARKVRSQEASARALELFLGLLTTEQAAEYTSRGEVTVRGSEGGLFVIETGRRTVHGNVVEIDAHGCRLARGCVQPAMWADGGESMPVEDGWVGQLMAIRHDELALRRVANWSNRTGCRRPDQPAALHLVENAA